MQNREHGVTEAVFRLAEIVRPILDRHGVKEAAVFGSVARGEAGPDSDVDLLVEYPPGTTLFDLVELKDELERALGRTVDLAHPQTLKPRIRDAILASRVPLP